MKTKSYMRLRQWARTISALIILFSLFFFIGEGGLDEPATTKDIIWFVFTIGLGFIGLLLAFKWELIGGIVSIIGFVVLSITDPKILVFPLMYIWPITAVLFIICWRKDRATALKKE